MIMTVTFFGDMIAREQVAVRIANGFMAFADSPTMVLVMINLLLLFLGMFIDALALQFLVLPMFNSDCDSLLASTWYSSAL